MDTTKYEVHDRTGPTLKAGLYRIWCGVYRLGDNGVHTLGDSSAFGGSPLIAKVCGLISEWMTSA